MRRVVLAAALLICGLTAQAGAEEVVLRAPPFELRAAVDGDSWRIGVRDAAGRERQVIAVESDATAVPPHLADADGDGAADLWVPVMTGNANTEYEIWRQDRATGRFSLAGVVSGHGFRRDPAGYLVAMGRNGCCAAAYEFYRGAGGRLLLAFTIGTRFAESGKVEDCTAKPEAEPPPEAVRRRWCAVGADDPRPGTRL